MSLAPGEGKQPLAYRGGAPSYALTAHRGRRLLSELSAGVWTVGGLVALEAWRRATRVTTAARPLVRAQAQCVPRGVEAQAVSVRRLA